jgi:hypothetical protein
MSALAELRKELRKLLGRTSVGFEVAVAHRKLALLLDALDARDEALRRLHDGLRGACPDCGRTLNGVVGHMPECCIGAVLKGDA